jgi:hypothetical protein
MSYLSLIVELLDLHRVVVHQLTFLIVPLRGSVDLWALSFSACLRWLRFFVDRALLASEGQHYVFKERHWP